MCCFVTWKDKSPLGTVMTLVVRRGGTKVLSSSEDTDPDPTDRLGEVLIDCPLKYTINSYVDYNVCAVS